MCEKEGAPCRCDGRIDRIERALKKLTAVGTTLGVVLTLFSILLTWQQCRLSALQADEARARRLVNMDVELKTSEDAPDKGLTVFVTATNNSTSSVQIAMVGIYVWKDSWRSGDTLQEKPELLVYADNLVADCPPKICPQQTPRGVLRTTYTETVPPGASMADGFGPYPVPAEELERGVWVQAFVRPVEQYDGSRCVLVGPPTLENGFPAFCEEARRSFKNCDDTTDCLFFSAVPLYYRAERK